MESLIRERMEEAWRDVKPWTARLGAFFLGAAFTSVNHFAVGQWNPWLGRSRSQVFISLPEASQLILIRDRNFVLPTVQ